MHQLSAATESAHTSVTSESPTLKVQLWHPTSTSVVVYVAGDVDEPGAQRLAEMLQPRLSSTLRNIVLDLSGVSFLCVRGVELIWQMARRAERNSVTLSAVVGVVCVQRAFRAAGLSDVLRTYPTLDQSLNGMDGHPRQNIRPLPSES